MPAHETYAYSASKAALHHLSRNFAGRVGWEGITSNTIAGGPFESKSMFCQQTDSICVGIHWAHLIVMAHTLATICDTLVASIPLTRIGTPEDVAGTALYLASRAGAYVSGATITLDGGSLVSTTIGKL